MTRGGAGCTRAPGATLAIALALVLVCATAACHGGSSASGRAAATTTTASPTNATTSTTTAPLGPAILLGAQGGELDAYATTRPFSTQVVVPSPEADPDGVEVTGQICVDPTDRNRFVAVDRTAVAEGAVGWGVFQLSGSSLGKLSATEAARLVPSYQPAHDAPTPYGCGFLPDGRLLTTDLGNQSRGNADGQLVEWFPPFDADTVASCKIDVKLASPQSVLVAGDRVYVAESRGGGIATFLVSTLPSSARASGGCAQRDPTNAALAYGVVRSTLIPVAAAATAGLSSPAGIAAARDGNLFVSVPRTGVIAEVTPEGAVLRQVLAPSHTPLGTRPFATGTPMGLAVAPDGALYYADPGLVTRDGRVVPGVRTGTIRRIAFAGTEPEPPEVVGSGLDAPLGVGIWIPAGS